MIEDTPYKVYEELLNFAWENLEKEFSKEELVEKLKMFNFLKEDNFWSKFKNRKLFRDLTETGIFYETLFQKPHPDILGYFLCPKEKNKYQWKGIYIYDRYKDDFLFVEK